MTAYTDAAIPGEPGSISIKDLLEFRDRRAGGYARVHFNIELVKCDDCGGVTGLVYTSTTGQLVRIDDPETAIRLHCIQEGYRLAHNEASANRGLMRGLDGHDGKPDDWMGVCEEHACACEKRSEANV